MKQKTTHIIVENKHIDISNPEKILFPDKGITKQDIVQYYADITPIMFPHVKNRLVTMIRYPDGIKGEGFYQKDTPAYFPSWIKRFPVYSESQKKTVKYVVINKKPTLAYLASQACITPHLWLSKINKLHHPDRLIIDLDPSGEKFDFNLVRKTAFIFRDLLEELNLNPFVMTTGSRGLHIVVPLKAQQTFEQVRDFANILCNYIADKAPKQLTTQIRKSARGKCIFLDYLRNSFGATAVAPYAIRPRPGAPVATPLEWKEVDDPKLASTRYNYKSVFKYLDKKGDVWADINDYARSLAVARKKLDKIVENDAFEVRL